MALWKDVAGYEGLYQVSDTGQVKSLARRWRRRDKLLKPGKRAGNYLFVVLNRDGIEDRRSVHRLVAEAFLPNPNQLPQVNHKDEDPTNNHVDNLEWCTQEYNVRYSKSKKVFQCIGDSVIAVHKSAVEAAKATGIGRTSINNALRGWSLTAGGYNWRYAND